MILLDTHVVIWLLMAEERLSQRAVDAILQARETGDILGYSPLSIYEIAYAARCKRLELTTSTAAFIAMIAERLEMVPLTAEMVVRAAELPAPFHGDPIDRMIAATAIVENCVLITHDEQIRKAAFCRTLW